VKKKLKLTTETLRFLDGDLAGVRAGLYVETLSNGDSCMGPHGCGGVEIRPPAQIAPGG
jgi:hypothetical protein